MPGEMDGDLPPWDRGRLLAHRISAGPTKNVQRNLVKAKRDRRGLLGRILPGRKRFLDGLISGLEETLERRGVSRRRSDSENNSDEA